MAESLRFITQALKAARRKKGLTQRQLSAKVGLPQSHLSKIENGAVDLQLSSLIQLARMLDLEFVLVPRPLILTVQALLQQREKGGEEQTPAYRLNDEDTD